MKVKGYYDYGMFQAIQIAAIMALREGDAMVFYTDGVSEAFNPQEECYGSQRLLADAGAVAGQSAPAIAAGLLQKVRSFANGAPQSDDIAILALRVGGAGENSSRKESRA